MNRDKARLIDFARWLNSLARMASADSSAHPHSHTYPSDASKELTDTKTSGHDTLVKAAMFSNPEVKEMLADESSECGDDDEELDWRPAFKQQYTLALRHLVKQIATENIPQLMAALEPETFDKARLEQSMGGLTLTVGAMESMARILIASYGERKELKEAIAAMSLAAREERSAASDATTHSKTTVQ